MYVLYIKENTNKILRIMTIIINDNDFRMVIGTVAYYCHPHLLSSELQL